MSKITFHTEQRKIADLIPASYNPRKMTEDQVKQLTASLEKYDLAEIPVINTDNTILAGHQRLKIMASLGRDAEVIDVRVPNRTLTEEECKEYNIRSNKNTGEWDFELLANNFDEQMLLDIGFTEFELGMDSLDMDPEDDETPEPPVEPKSQLGDLYELGGHRVLCGDSTKIYEVETLMNGRKADMVFTDPPYNVNYEGSNGLKIENDNKTDGDFYTFLLDAFVNYSMTLKAGGAIYVCHADLEGLNFRKAFKDAGFSLKSSIIWNKNAMVMGRADYQWKHEPILYGWKEGAAHSWFGDRKQTTVWDIQKPQKNGDHPTMKPVELVAKAIMNSSKQEDIVLDLFLGSGSTLIASEKVGRVCYGMELDPQYVDVIVSRYCKYTGNNKIIKNGQPIEWTD